MSDMTPTMRLRFIERAVETSILGQIPTFRRVRILQQRWTDGSISEWRDVPLEDQP